MGAYNCEFSAFSKKNCFVCLKKKLTKTEIHNSIAEEFFSFQNCVFANALSGRVPGSGLFNKKQKIL